MLKKKQDTEKKPQKNIYAAFCVRKMKFIQVIGLFSKPNIGRIKALPIRGGKEQRERGREETDLSMFIVLTLKPCKYCT